MTSKRPALTAEVAPAQAASHSAALQALVRLLARQAALEHVRAARAGRQNGPARTPPHGDAP
jgi:predicted glutamine amidotransferase